MSFSVGRGGGGMINHLNNCEEQSKAKHDGKKNAAKHDGQKNAAKHDGQKNANLSNDSKVKTVPVT